MAICLQIASNLFAIMTNPWSSPDELIFSKQFMGLKAIWQLMDRDVTHKIL